MYALERFTDELLYELVEACNHATAGAIQRLIPPVRSGSDENVPFSASQFCRARR